MNNKQKKFLNTIAQAIFDKKGINIIALDVRELSSLTDFLLIAEGNVERHVSALSYEIQEKLKEEGEIPIYVEGEQCGDWVVIDYINVMVHLFTPALREKFQLETLWKSAKIIDLDIDVTNTATRLVNNSQL